MQAPTPSGAPTKRADCGFPHSTNAALLLLFVFLARAPLACAGPRIQIDSPVWDFGARTNVVELIHDFVVRNVGDSDLSIVRVTSSCDSCLQAAVGTNRLAPGAATLLHARLDLTLLGGPVSRNIAVYSDDPANPAMYVFAQGTAVPAFEITPRTPILDMSMGASTIAATITPLFKTRAPLSRVQSDESNLFATILPLPSGAYQVNAQAAKSMRHGRFAVRLTVSSGDSNDFPCRIKVLVNNPPELEIVPDRLELDAQEAPQDRVIWIKQHGPSPLILLDVVPTSDNIHCEIVTEPSGCDYRVYVTAQRQEGHRDQSNALVLKMQDSLGKEHAFRVAISTRRTESEGH